MTTDPSSPIAKIVTNALERYYVYPTHYGEKRRRDIINKILSIRSEERLQQGVNEAMLLYTTTLQTKHLTGDIAELGCSGGGSSKVILLANNGNKKVHLLDTFEGLPRPGVNDSVTQFKEGDCFYSYESVIEYLKDFGKVKYYKGEFPSTAPPLKSKKFCFVHIDVDLYEPTLEGLKFFYPRMVEGGVIICHDYNTCIGAERAFKEYFNDKKTPIIEVNKSQCLVVKV